MSKNKTMQTCLPCQGWRDVACKIHDYP